MSQPPYNYGPYPGQPPPQPFPYAPMPVQVPGLQYRPPPVPNPTATFNLAATNAAFDHNASRIPGLGLGGGPTAAVAPAQYGSQTNSPWHQGSEGRNTSNTTPSRAGPQQRTTHVRDQHNSTLAPLQTSGSALQVPRDSRKYKDVSEEGELSEGEFEDLYESRGPHKESGDGAHKTRRLLSTAVDKSGSTGDADGSSIYDSGSAQEDTVMRSASASCQGRGRSGGSYSPHLSPREVQQERPTSKVAHPEAQAITAFQKSVQTMAHPSKQGPDKAGANGSSNSKQTTIIQSGPANEAPYKSMSEAKKKAQEAILGLWPLKVRYQDYIDEGFEPAIIKALFKGLGLDTSSSKTSAPMLKATTSAQTSPTTSHPTSTPAPLLPIVGKESKRDGETRPEAKGDAKVAAPTPGEERSAKIKRMLAAKAEKAEKVAKLAADKSQLAVPVQSSPAKIAAENANPALSTPLPAASTQNTTGSAPLHEDANAKARAEKNEKIKMKMEALKKNQREAAAKRRQDEEKQASVAAVDVPKSSNVVVPVPEKSTEKIPSSQELENGASAVTTPGPPLPSTQPATKIRNLKRPVASDFDSYSSPGNLKRTRTHEKLIIDVSDDEDVEMDMASPVDASLSAQNGTGPGRPSSLDTPLPSRSTTWRQNSSPRSSAAPTPDHGNKLGFLHKQIEDAKKKIAEAEAKKAVKRSNGTTPVPQTPADTESVRLPKVADAEKAAKDAGKGLRDRLVSYQLPVVEAALREKQEKLKRLQSEAAQLELELQVDLAEREKLTSGMGAPGDSEADEIDATDQQNNSGVPGSIIQLPGSQDSLQEGPRTKSTTDVFEGRTGSATVPESVPLNDAVAATANAPSTNSTTNASSIANEQHIGQGAVNTKNRERSESTDPADDKSAMDIETPESGGEAGVNAIGRMQEHQGHLSQHKLTTSSQIAANQSFSDSQNSAPYNEVNRTTGAVDDVSASDPHGAAVQPAAHNDADVSMQTSAAELSPSDNDGYEPVLDEMSDTDRNHALGSEDGEVLPQATADSRKHSAVLTEGQIAEEDTNSPQAPDRDVAPASKLEQPNAEVVPKTAVSEEEWRYYQSPLKYFRAFRYHPSFFNEVPGGLKSMTYSSRIDVNRPLCPLSLAGDPCPNGPNCKLQHFEDMTVSDTDLIAQIGSTDMYAGETKNQFVEGLKGVLNDLRAHKIKDFDRITRAILQFRSDFRDDKSRILPIGTVKI